MANEQINSNSELSKIFPMGSFALIKFSDDPTGAVFYMSTKDHTLQSFESPEAFNAAFASYGLNLDSAEQKGMIVTFPSTALSSGMALGGFKLLPSEYSIKSDGLRPSVPVIEKGIDTTKLSQNYGMPVNENKNNNAIDSLTWMLKNLQGGDSGISANTLSQVSNDPQIMGLYISSLAAGEYSAADVLRDIKRIDLANAGDESMKALKVIDEGIKASAFYSSAAGQASKSNATLTLPDKIGNINTADLDVPITSLSQQTRDAMSPVTDWTTPEGKALMDEIKTAFYDVQEKLLSSNTEAEHLRAQDSYARLQDEISKKYGIVLSNNAETAWNQLKSLENTYSNAGILDSGLFEEARDRYLQSIRKSSEQTRQGELTAQEDADRTYYQKYASPEEIAKLSEEQKEKYGLVPDAEDVEWFSTENLKKMYPELTDEQIKAYQNMAFDANGNRNSEAYSNLASNLLTNQQNKEAYQVGTVQRDSNTGKVIGGYGAVYEQALKDQKAREQALLGLEQNQENVQLSQVKELEPPSTPQKETKTEMPAATTAPSLTPTETNKIKGWNKNGDVVYVSEGYNPGISATPVAKTTIAPETSSTKISTPVVSAKTSTSIVPSGPMSSINGSISSISGPMSVEKKKVWDPIQKKYIYQ